MKDDLTLPLGDPQSATAGTPDARAVWGPFRLLARVGLGGFGEVYRAWDPNLQREVALKLLLPGVVDGDEQYNVMLREARAMASVQHPNILHVYGIDRHDGRVGFWTDFVRGKTLAALVASQGPLGCREAALAGIDISRALCAVHRAGLLHRDIKAENVMREDGGRILLMDFGLSVGHRSLGKPTAGTPNYMAPELFEGGVATVCTDIYAMGVLLYFLVIGDYPTRITGLSVGEAKAALAKRKPLMDLRPDLPEPFLRAVRVAMELDPARRFSSAGELAESLAASLNTSVAALHGETPKAHGVPASQPGHEPRNQTTTVIVPVDENPRRSTDTSRVGLPPHSERKLRNWVLAMAALLLVFAAAFIPWWMRHRAERAVTTPASAPYLAILPIANNTKDPGKDALTDGFTDDLIRQLSEVPHLKVISRTSVFRYKGQSVDAHSVGQTLHAAYVMTGTMERSGDRTVVNAELSDVGSNAVIFSRQYFADNSDFRPVKADIAHDLMDALHLDPDRTDHLGNTSSAAAYQLFLEGEAEIQSAAPADLHRAIVNLEQAVKLDPRFSLAWGTMAEAHVLLGLYFEPPNVQMPLGRHDVEEALKLDPTRPNFHGTLGLIHLVYDWDYPAAAAELASADAETDVFHVLSCSTHLMHEAGKSRHAEDILHRMEENDPESVQIVSELGCVAYYRGDYQEAISHYQEALKLDPHSPIAYWGIGKSLTQQGKFREAVEALQQFQQRNGFEPPLLTAETGYALAREGKVAEARQKIQTLQTQAHAGYVDPYLIAVIYLGLHDKAATYTWLGKAFDAKSSFMISILTDPKWMDSLSDPGFQNIVTRMNISESARQ
jgi:serine/threonine protein kinase/tetratricopeptide (TPR) repeat protein